MPMFVFRASLVFCLVVVLGFVTLSGYSLAQSGVALGQADMDQAIELLNEARRQFRAVMDYECLLRKQERVNGVLLPESAMTLKVRNKPFSLYLHCDSPEAEKGMEVC